MKQFSMIMGAMSAIDAIVSVQARGKNKRRRKGEKKSSTASSRHTVVSGSIPLNRAGGRGRGSCHRRGSDPPQSPAVTGTPAEPLGGESLKHTRTGTSTLSEERNH